jgi:hypothetical protein
MVFAGEREKVGDAAAATASNCAFGPHADEGPCLKAPNLHSVVTHSNSMLEIVIRRDCSGVCIGMLGRFFI